MEEVLAAADKEKTNPTDHHNRALKAVYALSPGEPFLLHMGMISCSAPGAHCQSSRKR